MILFISGSVNSGKSTTSKLLAKRLNAEWLDVDELADTIPNFNLSKDIPKAIELTIKQINQLTSRGKDVVGNYVLGQSDYDMLHKGLNDNSQYVFTLAPRLEVVRKDRGRGLNAWEYERIKHHYDIGIANPKFGEVLDTSDLNIEEVVEVIISYLPRS